MTSSYLVVFGPLVGSTYLSRRQTLEVGLYDSRNFPEDLHLAEGQLWEDYDFECGILA